MLIKISPTQLKWFRDETCGWADMTSALCINVTELFMYIISNVIIKALPFFVNNSQVY
jgi:hypothetical protein